MCNMHAVTLLLSFDGPIAGALHGVLLWRMLFSLELPAQRCHCTEPAMMETSIMLCPPSNAAQQCTLLGQQQLQSADWTTMLYFK